MSLEKSVINVTQSQDRVIDIMKKIEEAEGNEKILRLRCKPGYELVLAIYKKGWDTELITAKRIQPLSNKEVSERLGIPYEEKENHSKDFFRIISYCPSTEWRENYVTDINEGNKYYDELKLRMEAIENENLN